MRVQAREVHSTPLVHPGMLLPLHCTIPRVIFVYIPMNPDLHVWSTKISRKLP